MLFTIGINLAELFVISLAETFLLLMGTICKLSLGVFTISSIAFLSTLKIHSYVD